MHVWGSPLHAFDRTKLAGGRIVVRRARAGRDAARRSTGRCDALEPSDLLITDGERAVALAAIMGGARSRGRGGDDRGAARGGELRADRRAPHLRAARAAHGGLEQAGRRASTRTPPSPPPCSRAGCSSTSPARELTGYGRRPRRAAGASGRHAAARARESRDRPRRARRTSSARSSSGFGFEVARGLGRDRPDLARARRDARDRPRRGGRARRPRPRAADDAAAAARSPATSRRRSASAARSRTSSSAPGSPRRTRGASTPSDPDPDALRLPTR